MRASRSNTLSRSPTRMPSKSTAYSPGRTRSGASRRRTAANPASTKAKRACRAAISREMAHDLGRERVVEIVGNFESSSVDSESTVWIALGGTLAEPHDLRDRSSMTRDDDLFAPFGQVDQLRKL